MTSNCKIINNSFDSNYHLSGIFLEYSMNNTMTQNTIIANNDSAIQSSYHGILLWGSNGNHILDNTIISENDQCWGGLCLWYSNGNSVKNNRFVKNGLEWYESSDNVIEDNTVNGKPLAFLENKSYETIDDAGQVFLINCDHITVRNLQISHTENGIYSYQTSSSVVTGNTISWCRQGIKLERSRFNTISQNTLDHHWYGILLVAGFSNTISSNTITNGYYGGIYANSLRASLYKNSIKESAVGIHITGWGLNAVSTNILQDCTLGVYLEDTIRNTIIRNTFKGNNEDATFFNAYYIWWRRNY
jgi:parallel beta-helix repeat protein